jgi:hypothetical protein
MATLARYSFFAGLVLVVIGSSFLMAVFGTIALCAGGIEAACVAAISTLKMLALLPSGLQDPALYVYVVIALFLIAFIAKLLVRRTERLSSKV